MEGKEKRNMPEYPMTSTTHFIKSLRGSSEPLVGPMLDTLFFFQPHSVDELLLSGPKVLILNSVSWSDFESYRKRLFIYDLERGVTKAVRSSD